MKRIIFINVLKSKRTVRVSQDSNYEFIIFVILIYTDSLYLTPILIY
jgi:hypothetical protein